MPAHASLPQTSVYDPILFPPAGSPRSSLHPASYRPPHRPGTAPRLQLRPCPATGTPFLVLLLSSRGRPLELPLDAITHFRKRGSEVCVYLPPNRVITCQANLKQLTALLPAAQFCRIHRSFLVALLQVDALKRSGLRIGSQWIPITPHYHSALLRHMTTQLNQRYDLLLEPAAPPVPRGA